MIIVIFILCSVCCISFDRGVICLLCLIALPLPLGKNSFAVKINNNNIKSYMHPVVLIYHLFHISFRLKCILLSSHPSSMLHVSAVYGHYQASSILLTLLHCVVCQNYASRVNAIFPN
jgi:hypothetical protein